MTTPQSSEELAEALRRQALHDRTILLEGNGTKRRMAGPVQQADEFISTACLDRIREYEPRDLTISVEAGVLWRSLTYMLAENRQMIPLDPPFSDGATVGGVVASNCSGPRRRLHGTARDMVIGMTFATLEGKVVESGGMVVKNVAGLDMGKLMIGSFGTLAAISVVNFKVIPMPERERTFVLPFASAVEACAACERVLSGPLQPAALDLYNPLTGAVLGKGAWLLAIRASGNQATVSRYGRDLAEFGEAIVLEDSLQDSLWRLVHEFTPNFLNGHLDGVVVRNSCTLKEVESVMGSFPGPAVARAGSGICWGYFETAPAAAEWMSAALARGWKPVIEFSPENPGETLDLWPSPGGDFEMMQRVKRLFDPRNVLNRGRLYRRI